MTKYLEFKKIDKTKHVQLQNRKTDVWWIYTHSGDYLGLVQWYAPWRQYCLDYVSKGVVFAASCLIDIADFCKQQTKEYKERKK